MEPHWIYSVIEKEQTQLRVGRPKNKTVGFGYEEVQLKEINHVLTVVNTNHKQEGVR